jgi:hypothetical protein
MLSGSYECKRLAYLNLLAREKQVGQQVCGAEENASDSSRPRW